MVYYYQGNIVPSPDVVMVFGSNPEGRHGAGAAKVAHEQFGAVYGVGEGLTGNAYALPTKDLRVREYKGYRSISPEAITESVKKLYQVARENPGKSFCVAYRNTDQRSLNGYTGYEMMDMFLAAGQAPANVLFSKEWADTGKFGQAASRPLVFSSRYAGNGYEVSSRGDSRFSAFNARFADGTVIDGEDVSGMNIEDVYQTVVKRSGKGLAPAGDSRLSVLYRGYATKDGVPAADLDATVAGAAPDYVEGFDARYHFTTDREEAEGYAKLHSEKTNDLGPVSRENKGYMGDYPVVGTYALSGRARIARFEDVRDYDLHPGRAEGADVVVLKRGTLSSRSSEFIVREGAKDLVLPLEKTDRKTLEDLSFSEGYLPLWQIWAEQNHALVADLREKSAGKVLTDQFASTGVSPARALAYILNDETKNELLTAEAEEYKIKTPSGERSGADSGNPSSEGLLQSGSEHLSRNAPSQIEDVAKLRKNTEISIRSAQKIIRTGGLFPGASTPNRAVSMLGKALHFEKSYSSNSYYRDFIEGDFSLGETSIRVRISTHPANPSLIGNAPTVERISLVIYKDGEHKDRGAHNGYVEHIFYPEDISPQDAAMAIVRGFENMVRTGVFIDDTGKSVKKEYFPTQQTDTMTPEEKDALVRDIEQNKVIQQNNDTMAQENEKSTLAEDIERYSDEILSVKDNYVFFTPELIEKDQARFEAAGMEDDLVELSRAAIPVAGILRRYESLSPEEQSALPISEQNRESLNALAGSYEAFKTRLKDTIAENAETISLVHAEYFNSIFSFEEVGQMKKERERAGLDMSHPDIIVSEILHDYERLSWEEQRSLDLPGLSELTLDDLLSQAKISTEIVSALQGASSNPEQAKEKLLAVRDRGSFQLSDEYFTRSVNYLSVTLSLERDFVQDFLTEYQMRPDGQNPALRNGNDIKLPFPEVQKDSDNAVLEFSSPEQAFVFAKSFYSKQSLAELNEIRSTILKTSDIAELRVLSRRLEPMDIDTWGHGFKKLEIVDSIAEEEFKQNGTPVNDTVKKLNNLDHEPSLLVSYYGSRNIPQDALLVQISTSAPKGMEDKIAFEFESVYPDYKTMVFPHKDGKIDDAEYSRRYYNDVLVKNADKINSGIITIMDEARKQGKDAVLLCYEKAGTFCHRYLLSNFLNEQGIACAEVEKDRATYLSGAVTLFGEEGYKPLAEQFNPVSIQEVAGNNDLPITFTESSGNYAIRTRENAQAPEVDFTLALAKDFSTAGEKCTAKAAGDSLLSCQFSGLNPRQSSHVAVTLFEQLPEEFQKGKSMGLNIAGNGLYTLKEEQSSVDNFVLAVLSHLKLMGVNIASIRTGGQTGVDEAGAYAGVCLNVPVTVHAPKGFVMRDAEGKTISGREAFVSRFEKKDYAAGKAFVQKLECSMKNSDGKHI